MSYIKTFLGTLVLVPILTFTVWALYKAISLPGCHKIENLGENRKLSKTIIKKIIFFNIFLILILNIMGFWIQKG